MLPPRSLRPPRRARITAAGAGIAVVLSGLTACSGGGPDPEAAGKVLAEALDGSDLVSANLYRTSDEDVLKPCEMPAEKVLDFLRRQRPAEPTND